MRSSTNETYLLLLDIFGEFLVTASGSEVRVVFLSCMQHVSASLFASNAFFFYFLDADTCGGKHVGECVLGVRTDLGVRTELALLRGAYSRFCLLDTFSGFVPNSGVRTRGGCRARVAHPVCDELGEIDRRAY